MRIREGKNRIRDGKNSDPQTLAIPGLDCCKYQSRGNAGACRPRPPLPSRRGRQKRRPTAGVVSVDPVFAAAQPASRARRRGCTGSRSSSPASTCI
jgi:hypothetical protein